MARLPDLLKFADTHHLKIGTIADLIGFRLNNDPTVQRIATQPLQLEQGTFQSYLYQDVVEGGTHMALVYGELKPELPVAVRVHVHRGLLDSILMPNASDSWDLKNAMASIVSYGSGVLVLLSYHESAEELESRIESRKAPNRRKNAHDALNHDDSPANLRMLGAGGQILADIGVKQVLALGREKRAHGLSGFGLEVVEYVTDQHSLKHWAKHWEQNHE